MICFGFPKNASLKRDCSGNRITQQVTSQENLFSVTSTRHMRFSGQLTDNPTLLAIPARKAEHALRQSVSSGEFSLLTQSHPRDGTVDRCLRGQYLVAAFPHQGISCRSAGFRGPQAALKPEIREMDTIAYLQLLERQGQALPRQIRGQHADCDGSDLSFMKP